MSADAHPTIYLKDYAVPTHLIDRVEMTVAFDAVRTRISTRLQVRPNPESAPAPLLLDGDETELVSIALDGKPLDATAYRLDKAGLTLLQPPQGAFRLDIETAVNPTANTKLMGLYRSDGIYCTQCEADGFRRITYYPDRPDVMTTFRVRLEADKREAPVLLGNGNCIETGDLPGGRHFAVWDDPHKKPCYLFAMVGGDLDVLKDSFTTMEGRKVALGIYVEKGKVDHATYAMDALKRSFKWDEAVFGLPYDLDVFNVVAVSSFNMGAMENKGLNIFNDKFVLALPETATDTDYAHIEAIIAHEYFHNWTGNRITCRDWFQLCLKEGLTVYRDQEFSADMRSRAVERISDVRQLRSTQFVEDQGPLSHPVRPSEYKEINNFYTTTVYEKGAEVIRTLKRFIGMDAFKRGMDLYFKRHDGDAATIEQFIACFAEASEKDLSAFMGWYNQAGTPRVTMKREREGGDLVVTLKQRTPPTPGQDRKGPQVIPVLLGLVSAKGDARVEADGIADGVFMLDAAEKTIRFRNAPADAVPSLFRDFSAPVEYTHDLGTAEIALLARHDTDPFNRWQSVQDLATTILCESARARADAGRHAISGDLIAALRDMLPLVASDPAFVALCMTLPSEADIARALAKDVDPDAVLAARNSLKQAIAKALAADLSARVDELPIAKIYDPGAEQAQRRQLRSISLDLTAAADRTTGDQLAAHRFAAADNMTDRISALGVLAQHESPARADALAAYEKRHGSDPLAMDKWFALQALIPEAATLDRVKALMEHPAFVFRNPNRLRALIGAFGLMNATQFHRADGEGYRFIGQMLAKIDAMNPQVSARLSQSFRTWSTLEPVRRAKALEVLNELVRLPDLSRDLTEMVERIVKG
jgi:aminopeptidase N